MTLYSKLEKHLPRDVESTEGSLLYHIEHYKEGFNACKAQYDEVLRRVVVDEIKIWDILTKVVCDNDLDRLCSKHESEISWQQAKAIANSPDVIKVEGE